MNKDCKQIGPSRPLWWKVVKVFFCLVMLLGGGAGIFLSIVLSIAAAPLIITLSGFSIISAIIFLYRQFRIKNDVLKNENNQEKISNEGKVNAESVVIEGKNNNKQENKVSLSERKNDAGNLDDNKKSEEKEEYKVPPKNNHEIKANKEFKDFVEEFRNNKGGPNLETALDYVRLGVEIVKYVHDVKGKKTMEECIKDVIELVKGECVNFDGVEYKFADSGNLYRNLNQKHKNSTKNQNAEINVYKLIVAAVGDWLLQYISSQNTISGDAGQPKSPYNRAFVQGANEIYDEIISVFLHAVAMSKGAGAYPRLSSHRKKFLLEEDKGIATGVDFKKESGVQLSAGKKTMLLSRVVRLVGKKGDVLVRKVFLFAKSEEHGVYWFSDVFWHGIDYIRTRFSDAHQGDKRYFRKEHADRRSLEKTGFFLQLCFSLIKTKREELSGVLNKQYNLKIWQCLGNIKKLS